MVPNVQVFAEWCEEVSRSLGRGARHHDAGHENAVCVPRLRRRDAEPWAIEFEDALSILPHLLDWVSLDAHAPPIAPGGAE